MLKKILDTLSSPSIHSVDALAKELNTDKQSVSAALDRLKRLGYIIDSTEPCACAGKSCKNCNGCGGDLHKTVGAIYAIR